MKSRNATVRSQVEKNRKLFTAIRRSDVVMQLRSCMVAKDIRSVDIADRLGVSEANVSRWLRGNQNISIDTLYLLADAIEEPLTLTVGQQQGEGIPEEASSSPENEWTQFKEGKSNVVHIADHPKAFLAKLHASGTGFKPAQSTANGWTTGDFNEPAAATA
jgi:transcriptional regulator with XRE-family HTH domain